MKKYLSKRMLIIFLLGFSSGLPLALSGSLLQAWFKISGVDLVIIGCLSLIGQPYAYKFLWAPLLDAFKLPLPIDKRRGWILAAQLWIVLMILIMIYFNPQKNPMLLAFLGLLIAIGSATQDIVIDAYRIDILPSEERGLGVALATEGYRLAMVISGSVGFILADKYGWQVTYLTMAGLMLIGIITIWFAPPVTSNTPIALTNNLQQSILQPFKNFLQKDRAVWLLIFMMTYKVGDACSHALSSLFLLDLNFSLTAVGTINKLVGLIATLIGILFGGIIMVRVNLYKSLLFFGCLQCASNLLYALLAIVGKNYYMAIGVFFVENLCAGMGSTAFTVFLMCLCNKQYSATQYALFSSLSALGRIYTGPLAGYLVKTLGWQSFYCVTAILGLPGILLVILLKRQIILNDNRGINQATSIPDDNTIKLNQEPEPCKSF